MSLQSILKLHSRALESIKKYVRQRELFKVVACEKGKHFIGIVGPRGAGKTILLQQYVLQPG